MRKVPPASSTRSQRDRSAEGAINGPAASSARGSRPGPQQDDMPPVLPPGPAESVSMDDVKMGRPTVVRRLSETPLSVLDTSQIVSGSTAREALRNTLDLAQLADRLAYHGYWVAEHHSMRSSRSSASRATVAAAKVSSAKAGPRH